MNYGYLKSERTQQDIDTQDRYINRLAERVLAMLPASRADIMDRTGLAKHAVNKVMARVRQMARVITVMPGIVYEVAQPCGHKYSDIVHADEGTAFCGACSDAARYHGQAGAV